MELEGIGNLFGIKSPWVLKRVAVQKANMVIDVFIDFEEGSKFQCSHCGCMVRVHDSSIKRVRYLDLFDYRCYLNIRTPRTDCDRDGVKTAHADPWSRKGTHYCLKFEALIIRLCREMSVSAVGVELGEPDNNLWRTFKHPVNRRIINNFDFKDVKCVCVDETAVRRGQNYVTIFTDYDTGDVLYVADGRKKEVFSEFYGWLWDKGGYPGNIEYFSMDMSVSFQAGRRDNFAGTNVVFDRFHIKQCLGGAINEVRKEEVKEVEGLKKTKYLWLKNEGNLTEGQKCQPQGFLDDSTLKTALAYQLKNGFDHLWQVQTRAVAPLLNNWIQKALTLNLDPIDKFVNMIYEHYDGIIESILTGITNAVSEGLNSLVQLARSRARGFRNPENLKAMIYFLGNG